MTPFQRARDAAIQLRKELFGNSATLGIVSGVVISSVAAEEAEDFQISRAAPADKALGGADAILEWKFRQIIVRNDVSTGEHAFLVAHEFGHWKLHQEGHEGCRKVVESNLTPQEADTFGAQKVEAYGARERAELQANIFARELLLPREVARTLFLAGQTAEGLTRSLDLPLELVRQQLLDGLLLPVPNVGDRHATKVINPTEEQIAAATSKAKTSLVKAGPGTGKTATLLLRVKHLLSKGSKPEDLLILTFSNRAARELVDRLQEEGVSGAHDMWVGTFHAFGLEFLRKNSERFNLGPRFGVADKMAQIALLEPHIYGLGLTAFNPLGDPLEWLNKVVQTIQRAKDELATPQVYAEAVNKCTSLTPGDVLRRQGDVAKLYACYEAELRANKNLVDMGDLVMLPALALTENYDKFKASVGRFKHILVDEYQDVNRASAQLVKSLAAHAKSLWVVGDARQAIYRFRGASMRSIVNFGDDYPEFKPFTLNENRRSYEEVVRLFEHTGREDHPLQMVLPLEDVEPVLGASGVLPRHVKCRTLDIVRGELIENVERVHEDGVAYRDQVILASTHDVCGDAADALNAAGVPALHLGDIFQRAEVKDVLALLQLFIDRSGSGLLRVARLPGLEIPASDVSQLLAWLNATRPPPLSWIGSPPPGLSPEAYVAIQRWASVFDDLTSADSPWDVACRLLLDRTSILHHQMAGVGILDVTRRIALWQLIYFLRVPDGGHAYQNVGSFVTRLRRRLRIGDDRELRIPPPEADGLDAVAVMTIHGSKGLEYEAVHLVDVDAKHFRMSVDSDLMPDSLLKSIAHSQNFEERTEASNKLYVALSRAKEHLVVYERQDGYRAECVGAISDAAHLFEPVDGTAQAPAPRTAVIQSSAVERPAAHEFAGFLAYRVCPRRYYYDFVLGLSPAAGLHPAALIEGAVMRDLFVPYGADPSTPAHEIDAVLKSLGIAYRDSLPHLRAYADQLLAAGQDWLGAPRAAMGKPFEVDCAGLMLRVAPHRRSAQGNAINIEFVRTKPAGRLRRQHYALRWMLKHLTQAHPGYSITASVYTLSTKERESLTPDSRTFNNTSVGNAARGLLSGVFDANPNQWECPKCRHFLHCPA